MTQDFQNRIDAFFRTHDFHDLTGIMVKMLFVFCRISDPHTRALYKAMSFLPNHLRIGDSEARVSTPGRGPTALNRTHQKQ